MSAIEKTTDVSITVFGVHANPKAEGPYAYMTKNEHVHSFVITVAFAGEVTCVFGAKEKIVPFLSQFRRSESGVYDFGNRSCMDIASYLYPLIGAKTVDSVSVSDGEHTARVKYVEAKQY